MFLGHPLSPRSLTELIFSCFLVFLAHPFGPLGPQKLFRSLPKPISSSFLVFLAHQRAPGAHFLAFSRVFGPPLGPRGPFSRVFSYVWPTLGSQRRQKNPPKSHCLEFSRVFGASADPKVVPHGLSPTAKTLV